MLKENHENIRKNLEKIRGRIKKACEKAGKDPSEIILVAVSKTFPVSSNYDAVKAGHFDFGENKIQELVRKRSMMHLDGKKQAKWHMIGHLQTNKAKSAVENADLFHCLDSTKLADKLNKECSRAKKKLDVLVQINSSAEESKSGIDPGELNLFLKELRHYENLNILGLMSIGAFNQDPEDSREEFRFMKELFDIAVRHNGGNIDIKHLSMGMSSDFDIAIEEGADIIRIGTLIFGARS